MGLIFDLDQTIVDSSLAEPFRKARDWQAVYATIKNFIPYAGVIEAMNKFKIDGLKICIVTSSPSSYCTKVLHHWKIPYDYTVCYHDTVDKKPKPEPIEKALRHLGTDLSKTLSFGDRDIDIVASNLSKIASVACMWGASDIASLIQSNPTYTIKDSNELVDLVRRICY